MSWLTVRFLSYLLAATALAGALSTGWQYLGRQHAEKRAQNAENSAARAKEQVGVLTKKVEDQNKAVQGLQAKLLAKQGEVEAAQLVAKKAKTAGQARVVQIQAAPVPSDCGAAVNYLHDAIAGGGQ